jgi:hypothetical protein
MCDCGVLGYLIFFHHLPVPYRGRLLTFLPGGMQDYLLWEVWVWE